MRYDTGTSVLSAETLATGTFIMNAVGANARMPKYAILLAVS